MRKFLGEIPVVGQQQYPGSIPIESAYGVNPFGGGFFNQVHHGFSSLGVLHGSDMVLGFVQQDIYQVFAGRQLLSLGADIVFFRNLKPRLGNDLPVHRHFPRPYNIGGVAPGRNARMREKLIERHGIACRGFFDRRYMLCIGCWFSRGYLPGAVCFGRACCRLF